MKSVEGARKVNAEAQCSLLTVRDDAVQAWGGQVFVSQGALVKPMVIKSRSCVKQLAESLLC